MVKIWSRRTKPALPSYQAGAYRRKGRIAGSRVMPPKGYQPHYHIRYEATDQTIDLTATSGGATKIFGASSFSLDTIDGYGELTALYDQYKITKVILYLTWSPLVRPTSLSGESADVFAPVFMYCPDHDDVTTPTESSLKQRSKTKTIRLQPGKQYKIVITPSVLQAVYESAIATSYAPKYNQKIDMADPSVPHYGLKWMCTKAADFNMGEVNIMTKYYITCYNSR